MNVLLPKSEEAIQRELNEISPFDATCLKIRYFYHKNPDPRKLRSFLLKELNASFQWSLNLDQAEKFYVLAICQIVVSNSNGRLLFFLNEAHQ